MRLFRQFPSRLIWTQKLIRTGTNQRMIKGLFIHRPIIPSMRIDIMRFHVITINNAIIDSFRILSPIIFKNLPVKVLSKGRIWQVPWCLSKLTVIVAQLLLSWVFLMFFFRFGRLGEVYRGGLREIVGVVGDLNLDCVFFRWDGFGVLVG